MRKVLTCALLALCLLYPSVVTASESSLSPRPTPVPQGQSQSRIPSRAEVRELHFDYAPISYLYTPQYRRDAALRMDASIAREVKRVGQDEIGGGTQICMSCACTIGEHMLICPYFVPTPAGCFMHPWTTCIWYDPNKLLPGGGNG